LVQVGRFEEAIAEGKQAVALDPLSLALNLSLGLVFYFARRYDQTIEQQRKALELEPNFAPAHTLLSLAYLQKSMIQEAIAESQKVPPPRVTLGYAYAVGGNRPEAQKVLDQLSALSNKRYVSAAWFVLIYLGLGEKEKAFEVGESLQRPLNHFPGHKGGPRPRSPALRSPLRRPAAADGIATGATPGTILKQAKA